MTNSLRIQYIVCTWVPDELLDEWNAWHNQTHIPDVLATPMIRGARKYRVSDTSFGDWQPQPATIYEVGNAAEMQAYLDGPALRLRQAYADKYGAVGKIARMILSADMRFEGEL